MAFLSKIISGGQTGADQAGLFVAKRFGLETGGTMPKGFKTLEGSRPDIANLFGMVEHPYENYAARTGKNVQDSCGTVRFAGDFGSAGEICTLKEIRRARKPYFDVDLTDPVPHDRFLDWLTVNNISVLNIAGNSEQTFLGAYRHTYNYLRDSFFKLGLMMTLSKEEILAAFSLDNTYELVFGGEQIEAIKVRSVKGNHQ